ncbi:MAG: hypothetical protein A2600_09915 [Candidatus Lambdaproteobacteria bacterium RIFOXYD1_FULL_56_27]|uniref:Type IV conjugative transfer system protein TraE n=1 Tax=Candidatus Lambdaproteobacteria bacterium RIFOXYD2_FULL_56_26 TaxID=1817773 RepID=A0A1F6GU12_9PROT|nr:MAG: hypothetical protein A2557_11775 [Candidatus Lambdaproteobacteria bacterium RIFOXYD2_FULL_56_26]OGH04333.1 MAG: hypothetical protein A2426_05770 [Candidatus Lambdaproteobacteria bacterium RIFOXYC1_FULL_56_13]OGH07395.1 MAG: hypothetical protein A2600_09915 [Candidatus Lambdaproteobacteria bacterium RIFOXYD1_FULL_56_27]
MLGLRYLSVLNRVYRENLLLKLSLVALVVITWLNYKDAASCRADRSVILIPPGAKEAMSIKTDSADEAYLRQMSRYVAALALNYTPSTIEGQFAELLTLYDGSTYPQARKGFEVLASSVVVTNLTQAFYLQEKITVEPEVQTLTLKGLVLRTINSEAQAPLSEEYKLRYKIESGEFRILEFWKYQKDQPQEPQTEPHG